MKEASYKIVGLVLLIGLAFFANSIPAQSQFGGSFPLPLGDFCVSIGLVRLDEQVAYKISRFQNNHQSRMQSLAQRQARQDANLNRQWQKWQSSWQRQFDNLALVAQNPNEQQALVVFRQEIEAAMSEMRATGLSAVVDYRNQASSLIAETQNGVVATVDAYYYAVKAAFDQAKTACNNSPDNGDAIRARFRLAMTNAENTLRSQQQNIEQTSDQITNLAIQRNQITRQAMQKFLSDIEATGNKLLANL